MLNSLKMALAAALNGTLNLADGALLLANGCPLDVPAKAPEVCAELVKGSMLSPAQMVVLAKAGADVTKLLGLKRPFVLPTEPTVEDAAVLRLPTEPTANGNATAQEVKITNDPFAFILRQKVETTKQKAALMSLYNSMTSRTQTKVVEGYKHSLRQHGVVVDEKAVSEAMKDTRQAVGLDKMLDSVLFKKGFVTSKDEQDNLLVETLRDNLSLCGVGYSDEVHFAALSDGKIFAQQFADLCVNGLKARGLTFAS